MRQKQEARCYKPEVRSQKVKTKIREREARHQNGEVRNQKLEPTHQKLETKTWKQNATYSIPENLQQESESQKPEASKQKLGIRRKICSRRQTQEARYYTPELEARKLQPKVENQKLETMRTKIESKWQCFETNVWNQEATVQCSKRTFFDFLLVFRRSAVHYQLSSPSSSSSSPCSLIHHRTLSPTALLQARNVRRSTRLIVQ